MLQENETHLCFLLTTLSTMMSPMSTMTTDNPNTTGAKIIRYNMSPNWVLESSLSLAAVSVAATLFWVMDGEGDKPVTKECVRKRSQL